MNENNEYKKSGIYIWYIYIKEEQNHCRKLDKSRDYHVKQNKPDSKRHSLSCGI
jgi:hypothetical protein